MANYLSSFLTTTTTKYQSIRRALINSDADGDTEDDSHISRALRSYYTEKGRPFPDWLPPDPNAPPPPQPVSYNSAMNQQQGMPPQPGAGRWGQGRGGGGLSDLWDNKGGQQPMQQQPDSLRPGRFGQQQQEAPMGGRGGGGRFGDLYGDQGGRPQAAGRASSYQSGRMQDAPSPAPSAGSGNTAKDMLKQKLWGSNRTESPTPSAGSGGYGPPVRDNGSPYGGGGGGGGGGNPYDAPSGRPQYGGSQSSYGANDSYGGGGRQGGSGSSWGVNDGATGGSQNSGSARGYGGGPYGNAAPAPARGASSGGRMGLPSGPRPRRT